MNRVNFFIKQITDTEWQRFLPIAISLLAIILIVDTIISAALFFWPTQQKMNLLPVKTNISQVSSPVFLAIPQWHLFGQSAIEESRLAISTLQFRLVGILLAGPGKKSAVIILGPNDEEKIYYMHDHLPGGATIDKILPTSVIISNNGKREQLLLEKPEKNTNSVANPQQPYAIPQQLGGINSRGSNINSFKNSYSPESTSATAR